MAKNAALNPASLPFFPVGFRPNETERGSGSGMALSSFRDPAVSSLPVSPSEFRSARSSPSLSYDEAGSEPSPGFRLQSSPLPVEARQSPAFRLVDDRRPYPAVETRVVREDSLLGTLEMLPEGEDTPGPITTPQAQAPLFFSAMQRQGREPLSTPPVALGHSTSRSSSYHTSGALSSSSPVSSLDSGSHFTPSIDHPPSFESQLTASPMIQDLLNRLIRCEYSTREIQHDIGDIRRKVNLLVERSLGVSAPPEFKDPFVPQNANGRGYSPAPSASRLSMVGPVAPNQSVPTDDINQISRRLNNLTASVGQLLSLQTRPHIQATPGLPHSPFPTAAEMVTAPVINNRPDLRPSPRVPNPPYRTWSAGVLDIPARTSDAGLNRQDPLRDKRRSHSGLSRRESSGVCSFEIHLVS
jgi:hypothetical protein